MTTVKRNFLANDRNMYAAASCNDHFYNRLMSEGLRVKQDRIDINKKDMKKIVPRHKTLRRYRASRKKQKRQEEGEEQLRFIRCAPSTQLGVFVMSRVSN